MNPDVLALLCDPITHAPLQLVSNAGIGESLMNPASGKTYPIRDGIAIFLDSADATGQNQRYQRLYDRLAPFYDFSMQVYARIKSGG